MIKHARLDMKPVSPTPDRAGLADGVFVEKTSERMVRVELPPQSNNVINVTAEPGVYGVGADVIVRLGRDGKPVGVIPPQALPEGVEPLGVGVTGETTLEAKTVADKAAGDALDALDDAAKASNAAADALEESKRAWREAAAARESIGVVDSSAKAAEQAARNAETAAQLTQQALDAATAAQRLENEALKDAAGEAKTTADAARAKADGLAKQAQDAMTAAQQAQTSADGKALVAYSNYRPATVKGQKIIWFKPGSVPKLFDGNTWQSVQPGDGVVSAIDINKATVGELSGMRIKAGTASVDILIPGENARWTSSGLTIYHPLTPEQRQAGIKPTEWDKRATALNLTSEGARFISVADDKGTVTAYMSPQGEVSGRELTITGQAAVESLTVGGLDLQEVISLNSSLAAYTVLPVLWHQAGLQTVIVAQTGWQAFPPGLYAISWLVPYQYYPGTGKDAAGAFLNYQSRPAGGEDITDETFVTGESRVASYQTLWDSGAYATSHPNGVFEAKPGKEYRFTLGLHSYSKWKMSSWPSLFKVERLNPALELTHAVYNQSAPPAPPAPKTVTASVRLTDLWYAYGSTFAQSGSYQSGGNFRIPGAKGKKIKSIRLTGKCNSAVRDGGRGLAFSFHLGGENRSQKIYDYGAVDITYGATAGATLSRNGYVGFRVNNGAPDYVEYNVGAFRLTVVYQ